MADTNPYRLPRTVVPERYELTLRPELDTARFSGEERVTVEVRDATAVIRLNAAEIEIISAELIADDGTKLAGAVTLDEESEVANIALSGTAQPGTHTLHLTFSGILNDKLRGFYRSTYKDDEGKERVIATTQFEATDARRAFPCWDEPDLKAVFSITLIVDEELEAFSNAQVLSDALLGNGKRQVTFADTIKMSTYIVAFIVGPLVATDPVHVDGTPLRVACAPGREQLTSFALEAGAGALRYFTGYFKIDYAGGKLDMIALPDFAFGAMENLGCVTYRETALLVDVERASRLEVERVADVVGHEIAHMWFGDLVTMKWWNGIWLNEAFATFMETKFVDQFRPEWQRWATFGLSRAAAMTIDSLSSTRPIEFEVVSPAEARGMFDVLTYEKGCAVLRMLEQHVGADVFSAGISQYLRKHEYGNAETADLWDALEGSSNEPVRSMMDTWILQGGHPLVSVSSTGKPGEIKLTQTRFRYLGSADDSKQLWHVPIGIRASVAGEIKHQKLLMTDQSVVVTFPSDPDWLIINEHANGFFRCSYDTHLLGQIMSNIDALDMLERFNLVSDMWAACIAGHVSISDVLELVKVLGNDDDPNVWSAILAPLRLIDKLVDESLRSRFEQLVCEVARPQFERLGWQRAEVESEQASTLRGVLIAALGSLARDPEVQAEAARRYSTYLNDPASLDADLVEPVETVLATTNDHSHFEHLYAKFTAETSTPQERVNALEALACFSDKELVDRLLNMILDGSVRSQDAPYTLRIMVARRETGAYTWDWCEQNWGTLIERFPDNSIARMVEGTATQLDPVMAAKLQNFMAAHPVPQAQKMIDQTCERLRVNVAFNERNKDKLPSLLG